MFDVYEFRILVWVWTLKVKSTFLVQKLFVFYANFFFGNSEICVLCMDESKGKICIV